MDIQTLIKNGEELRDKKWEIQTISNKAKNGIRKEYLIDYPFNSIFEWDLEISKYINRRFGKFSSQLNKSVAIDRRRVYKQYLKLLDWYTAFEPRFPTKVKATERVQFMSAQTTAYTSEKLKLLESINLAAVLRKTVYGLSDVKGAVGVILKTKNISDGVKSKLCGNLLSQAIVVKLWSICKAEGINYKQNDEIDKLAQLIQKRVTLPKLNTYFRKNYSKFSRANRVRNQSCHAYEKPASINDIKSLNELYVELDSLQ